MSVLTSRTRTRSPAKRARILVVVGSFVEVGEQLDAKTELLAVVQRGVVVLRDACRSRVEVRAVVELGPLRNSAELLVFRAVSDRPATTTGTVPSFEKPTVKTDFSQFIGRAHAGQPRAKDDNPFVGNRT